MISERDDMRLPPRERLARDLFDAREAVLVIDGKLNAPREWKALTDNQRGEWTKEADAILARLVDQMDAIGEP